MKQAASRGIHQLGVEHHAHYKDCVGLAALCLALGGPLSAADAKQLSAQDKKFIMGAAKGGMMEVHMGKMGQEHGASDGVKSLSMRLIEDHTKGNDELTMLAMQKGVTLPSDSSALDPKGLSGLSGAAFDRKFAMIAVADHQKDIAEFEKEANSGSDPDVKMWAMNTRPPYVPTWTQRKRYPNPGVSNFRRMECSRG